MQRKALESAANEAKEKLPMQKAPMMLQKKLVSTKALRSMHIAAKKHISSKRAHLRAAMSAKKKA